VPAMATVTQVNAVDKAAELLLDNICPVCFCKKSGKNPRHQLVMHFRRAVDADHKQFRTKEYLKHFKVGRSKNPVTHDCIYKTIEKSLARTLLKNTCTELNDEGLYLLTALRGTLAACYLLTFSACHSESAPWV
jgi:hypothetical protein